MIKKVIVVLAVGCFVAPARADLWQDLSAYNPGDESNAPDKLDELVGKAAPGEHGAIEKGLIRVLESRTATATGKGYACRMLQRIGTRNSIPALSGLLGDKVLSHYARLALERMEDIPQAGEALRNALAGAPDSVKPGLMGSLAERRDKQAAEQIIKLIASSDQNVAAAAMKSLGKIGGKASLQALTQAKVPAGLKGMRLEAIVACAAGLAAEGEAAEAYAALSSICQGEPSDVHRVAAVTEMVRIDEGKASAVVIDLIKGKPSRLRDGALRLVVTGGGDKLTAALIGSLDGLDAGARAQVIELLGKRGDRAALPTAMAQLRSEDKAVRQAAIAAVGELGGAGQVRILLEQAKAGEAEAYDALARMAAEGIDAALIASLEGGAFKVEALKAVAMRGCRSAATQAVKLASDPSDEVRLAAWSNMADLATENEMDSLMKLLVGVKDGRERSAARGAVAAICSEATDRDKCFDAIAGHYKDAEDETKLIVLELGSSFGTAKALDLERAGLKSGNEGQRKAAVRALAAWPNSNAARDLLALAREEESATERIVALRGYIQVSAKDGSDAAKAGRYKAAFELAQRREDKWLLISMLKECRHIDSLRLAKSYFGDADAGTAAGLAAIDIARRMQIRDHRDEVLAILTSLAESSKDKNVVSRAKDCLESLKK